MYECDFACEVISYINRQSFNLLYHPATKQINHQHCIKTTIVLSTAGQTSEQQQQQLFQLVIPLERCVDIISCVSTGKQNSFPTPFPNLYMFCELNRLQVLFFLSELQCVTSSDCSEHCSHIIFLHVADFLSLFLYSGYGPAVEERRMESDCKIRTTTSPIS